MRKEKTAYLFILPSVALFALFVLYPLILSFILSFQKANLTTSSWVGLANYIDVLTDRLFYKALANTMLFVVFLVPAVVLLSYFVALLLAPLGKGWQTYFRAAFYFPVVVSGVVVSMIWLWIFNPVYGLLNYLLSTVGIAPVTWLSSRGTLYWLMLVVFTINFGLPVIIYMAAICNIPGDLFEAARIDGASRRQVDWKITWPLLKPSTFFLFVTQTIAVFQTWVVIQMLTNGGPAHSTETIVFQIYTEAFTYSQYGRASAMGMILLVIVVVLTLAQKLYAGEDVSY
jgi:ABC-type sugar transport systems, permease components